MHEWYNHYDCWTIFSLTVGLFAFWAILVGGFGAWKVFIEDKSNEIVEEPKSH